LAKKKKKKDLLPPCQHCGHVFDVKVCWCAKCETHVGAWERLDGDNVCDMCASGANDEYLIKRAGSAERIAAALEASRDQKNWSKDGVVEAFERWVNSPEYAKRFD
jgi:hypothetical protein